MQRLRRAPAIALPTPKRKGAASHESTRKSAERVPRSGRAPEFSQGLDAMLPQPRDSRTAGDL
jgi:hypothetical protein